MNTAVRLVLVAVFGAFLFACETSPKADGTAGEKAAVATYKCPSCTDIVQWQYRTTKPWIVEGKKIVHQCPECTKEWESCVHASSTCARCAEQALACPGCKQP